MSTSTSTAAYTRTHTATYLSEAIMGSIAEILGTLKIDASRLSANWDQDQSAISAWIEEGSLKAVVLECVRPDGTVSPIFEFPVTYEAGGAGDASFVHSRALLARHQAKLAAVPSGTSYRLVCSFSRTSSAQPGWGSGTRASTAGLRSASFGSIAEGPHARAGLRYFH